MPGSNCGKSALIPRIRPAVNRCERQNVASARRTDTTITAIHVVGNHALCVVGERG